MEYNSILNYSYEVLTCFLFLLLRTQHIVICFILNFPKLSITGPANTKIINTIFENDESNIS